MFGFKRKSTPARDLTVGRTSEALPTFPLYGGPTLGTSTALKVTIKDGPEGFTSEYVYDDENEFADAISDFGRLYGHRGTLTITVERI